MSTSAASNSAFASLGEEFCWHARHYAGIYGSEFVDSFHLLLAAAEVSPLELHRIPQLTPASIAKAEARLLGTLEPTPAPPTGFAPRRLSLGAQKLVSQALGFAARTGRALSLRDIWVAIAQAESVNLLILEELGVDRERLYRQVAGL